MGYIVHHTISVTSYDETKLRAARNFALSTGALVSDVVVVGLNGFYSFLVAPDGWPESVLGDVRRDAIKMWLRHQAHSDGSTPLYWFEVEHPEDSAPRVVDHQSRRPDAKREQKPVDDSSR